MAVCDVFFFDVGQGSCSAILDGVQSGVVIDCGRASVPYLDLLKDRIKTIRSLVISHAHADHYAGAKQIVLNYTDPKSPDHTIDEVVYLFDPYPTQDGKICKHFIDLFEFIEGRLGDNVRIIDGTAWNMENGLKMSCIHPALHDGELPEGGHNENCGVVLLEGWHNRNVLFTADVPYSRLLHDAPYFKSTDRKPFIAVTVPHHGGQSDDTEDDIEEFFGRKVQADVAVVSAGSQNDYEHPRGNILAIAAQHQARIGCTQMTNRCCDPLEQLEPHRIPRGVKTKQKGQACLGTTKVQLSSDPQVAPVWGLTKLDQENTFLTKHIHFATLDEHQAAVDQLQQRAGGKPMCRPKVADKA